MPFQDAALVSSWNDHTRTMIAHLCVLHSPSNGLCLCCTVVVLCAEVHAIMESEGPEKMLVLYCSQGGVLESTEQHKRGWQTRLVGACTLSGWAALTLFVFGSKAGGGAEELPGRAVSILLLLPSLDTNR